MKVNGKEVTLGQIASLLTIIALLSSGGFFVHGYFAKSAELAELQTELTTYKTEQKKEILRLKQEAQLESWATEQTFIVIRKDTILDRLVTESKKGDAADDFQIGRWNSQLEGLSDREAEIKSAREALKLQMLNNQ